MCMPIVCKWKRIAHVCVRENSTRVCLYEKESEEAPCVLKLSAYEIRRQVVTTVHPGSRLEHEEKQMAMAGCPSLISSSSARPVLCCSSKEAMEDNSSSKKGMVEWGCDTYVPESAKILQDWLTVQRLPPQKLSLERVEAGGRGLVAKTNIRKGEKLLYVPSSLIITANSGRGSNKYRLKLFAKQGMMLNALLNSGDIATSFSQSGCSNCLKPKRTFGNEKFDLKVYLSSSVEGVCSSREFGSIYLYQGVNELLSRGYKKKMELANRWYSYVLLAVSINFPAFLSFTDSAHAESSSRELDMIYGDISAGLDLGVQVLYLAALLGLIGVGSFFVVRQLLIRRELESAAKDLQDRVRTGEALPVEYFELGAVMLRKKFFVLAAKYLEQAIEKWDGDPQDLAQVHNALGFSLVSDGKIDKGIAEYEKAVKLQPGYVVAWNNLGSAYQKKKNLPKALKAYEQALFFDPNNNVAREYQDALKKRLDRLAGVPVKYD